MKSFVRVLSWMLIPVKVKGWISNILLAVPRVGVGLILAFEMGVRKFGMPWTSADLDLSLFEVSDAFVSGVDSFGLPFSQAPGVFAWLAAASEAIGGLFLVLGLGTRFFSFLLMVTMLVAVFFSKWEEGVIAMLPALGFLWVSIYGLIIGSGKIGLDYLFQKYKLI